MNNPNNTELFSTRIAYIDVAKGASMLMIIFCHCLGGGAIGSFFLFFHVPIFFFISGLFIKNNESVDKFMKYAKRLLLPFYIWGVGSLILCLFVFDEKEGMYEQFISFILARRMPQIFTGALWFLPCLFCTHVLHSFICRVSNPIKLFVLFFFLSQYVFLMRNKLILPFNIDIALFMIFFLESGCRLKKLVLDGSLYNIKLIAFICLICIVFCFVFRGCEITNVNYYYGRYGYILPTIIIAFAGIYSTLGICFYINKHLGSLSKILCGIGRQSMGFMILHQIYVIAFLKYIEMDLCKEFHLDFLYFGPIQFLVVVLLTAMLIKLLSKSEILRKAIC